MAHPVLRLFDGLPDDAPFRFDRDIGEATPRTVEALREDLERHAADGVGWVVLDGPEPLAHPQLVEALRGIEEAGLRARLTTTGVGLAQRDRLERLRDAGVAQLTLLAYGGTAATHDARTGRVGSFDELLQAVEIGHKLNRLMVTVRFVLLRDNVAEAGALVALVRDAADKVEVVRLSALTSDPELLREHGVGRRPALDAVQQAWEAARVSHLKLLTEAFATWPEIPMPSDAVLQPVDATLLNLFQAGVPLPSTANGTWMTPPDRDVRGLYPAVEAARGLQELGLLLAAWGAPSLDLPASHGGLGLDRPPGSEGAALERTEGLPSHLHQVFGPGAVASPPVAWRGVGRGATVHVVNGPGSDGLLALSTLPSLARRLAELGATTVLHSCWDAPFNPHDRQLPLPDHAWTPSDDPARPGLRFPLEVADAFAATPARYAHAVRHAASFYEGLDLTGAELVVVGGFEGGLAVATHPTLPPDARVVVADFHHLAGITGWIERWLPRGARPMDGGWWPGERFTVHSLFPRNVRTYWRSGVPLRQVHWRTYPVDHAQLPTGPDPREGAYLVAGGSHQRDWRVLARAASTLRGRTRPLVVYTKDAVPPPLQSGGELRLLHFYEALANARFVVLPLTPDPRRPAGISAGAMALAAGRPVIATCTVGTVDHLHHGTNAILVPPEQPAALAQAIERLDKDDALLVRLADGARASAERGSVLAWARDLLDGAPATTTWPETPDGRGPFRPWPS